MSDTPPPAYGSIRGSGVSYLEVERAAIAILKAGARPSVERVRAALGRGSPQTLLSALQRFWRDLGSRVEADPAALSRLPVEIVELVEGIWQRALTLASQAAKRDDNAARARLEERRSEVEVRAQALLLRERDLEAALRGREQALQDAQAQVRMLLGVLDGERATLRARESRIRDLEAQLTSERTHLATLIRRRVTSRRASPPARPSPVRRPVGKAARKSSRRPPARTARHRR